MHEPPRNRSAPKTSDIPYGAIIFSEGNWWRGSAQKKKPGRDRAYSMPKPVDSALMAMVSHFCRSAFLLYSGMSMRLKHVCERGKI